MIKKLIILTLLLSYLPMISTADGPIKHRIIIDTDCAPDDLRAINLFLSSTNTEVLAITSEDGVLDPEEGFIKINSLLNDLGHQGIKMGQGIISKNEVHRWRGLAQQVQWGKEPLSYSEPLEIKEFLINIIEHEEEPVKIICTGPLTNIANAVLMKPSIKQHIGQIIWFDQCQPNVEWTNYDMDCISANYLLNTQIPVYRIVAGDEPVELSESLLGEIGKIHTPYAQKIYRSHTTDAIREKLTNNHLKLLDELTALYLYYPEMFEKDTTYPDAHGNVIKLKEENNASDKYLEHLQAYNQINNMIFKNFPVDTNLYQKDVREMADETIKKYGIREWKAVTLTEEIQRHPEPNSVVGAKMGIRALEYFHTIPQNIQVTSYCGNTPPLSFINDGLQVSCGTTLGSGNIKIVEEGVLPKALFGYKNSNIEIKLKTEYYQQMQSVVEEAKRNNPYPSDSYRQEIREKTLFFWKNWDRKEIFQISEVSP